MTKIRSELQKGVLGLVVLALMFASMGIFARYLSHGFTIFQQVYLRVFAALILCLIVFSRQLDFQKISKITKKEWGVLALRGILLYGLGVPLLSQALLDTKYGSVSFVSSLPFIALFGVLFFKERLTVLKSVLILMAVAGVGLIAIKDPNQLLSWGRGEVLALLAGAFVSLSYVARRWHGDSLNNQEMTTIMLLFGALSSFVSSVALSEGVPTNWTWAIIGVVILAGAANIINLLLTNYGFSRVSNVLASNILTLQVLFAVIIGYVLYQENLGPREWFGGLLIVLSVMLMNKYAPDGEPEST